MRISLFFLFTPGIQNRNDQYCQYEHKQYDQNPHNGIQRLFCRSIGRYFSYEQRKAFVEAVKYVDLVIPEKSWDQKRSDMHEYHVDTFVIGDDRKGKFDFLKDEGIEVVYLPRTPEISNGQIKNDLYGANAVGDEK